MKIKLETETGEYLCDLELTDKDVARILDGAFLRLQNDPKGVQYNIPLKETDIIKILQYEITSMLKEEINKEKQK